MMKRILVGTASALAVILMSGCASHVHNVAETMPEGAIAGQMIHGVMRAPNRLSLLLDGTSYEGEFRIERTQNLTELRRRYIADRKHWDRIFAGHDTDHIVNVATATLVSKGGSTLPCDLAWRSGEVPAGVCVGQGGKSFSIRFD